MHTVNLLKALANRQRVEPSAFNLLTQVLSNNLVPGGILLTLTGFVLWPSYNGHFWGYIFFRGIFPSKIGRFAPFLATIQALSKTCVFLFNKRSEGCFVSDAPPLRTGAIIKKMKRTVGKFAVIARIGAKF
jgi:hypothetical protein